MKLALAMIVRDVAPIIERCLASVTPHVDEVVVGDTGSTDGSQDIIRRFMAGQKAGFRLLDLGPAAHPELFLPDTEEKWAPHDIPGPYTGQPFLADFSAARNLTFAATTTPFILWLDSDDVLAGGQYLGLVIDSIEKHQADSGLFHYDYAHDHLGNVTCRLIRERVMKRDLGKWLARVHEVYAPSGKGILFEEARVVHRRFVDNRPFPVQYRNLKILCQARAEELARGEPDPRTLFYLGMEWRCLSSARTIEAMNAYVKVSGWDEERALAHLVMGLQNEKDQKIAAAETEYEAARVDFPWSPDPLFGLARLAYYRQQWTRNIELTEAGFKLVADQKNNRVERHQTLMVDELDRIYRPYIFYARALCEIGRIGEAQDAAQRGLKAIPGDPTLEEIRLLSAVTLRKAAYPMKPNDQPTSLTMKFEDSDPLDAAPRNIPDGVLLGFALEMWRQNRAHNMESRALTFLDNLPPSIALAAKVREARALTLTRLPRTPDGLAMLTAEHLGPTAIAASSAAPLCVRPVAVSTPAPDSLPAPAPVPAPAPAPASAPASPAEPAERVLVDNPILHPVQRQEGVRHPILIEGDTRPPTIEVGRRPLDILLWTGPALEDWGPRNLHEGGIGGSETAAIHMARELSRRGHRVSVYSQCGAQEGNHDGVEYHNFNRLGELQGKTVDIFISSRQPQIFQVENIKARASLLWVHDINVGPASVEIHRAFLRTDRILCLSAWHRDYFMHDYPFLSPRMVLQTRNGIDTSRYAANPVKEGNRLIFSSSPNRGLDRAINLFGQVKAKITDAELHVYYGFENWQKVATMWGNQPELQAIAGFKRQLEEVCANPRSGVFWHGRVSQTELAREQLRSKIWAYPTAFDETSCITAMECQAAGCIPVTSHRAALPETVTHGFLLKGSNATEEYGQAWVRRVIWLLENEDKRARMAADGRAHALNHSGWDKVAAEWDVMMETVLVEKERYPITFYGSEQYRP